jgi:Fur family peroxide stress response transcriptional regulator
MKDYTTILREHNLKATPQRLEILENIAKYGHINIDKLFEKVRETFNSISLATIYKNINAMIENTILVEVKLPNTKTVYEIVKQKHYHLLCNNCQSIIDVEIDTSSIIDSVSTQYNFKVDKSDVVLSGTCKNCFF